MVKSLKILVSMPSQRSPKSLESFLEIAPDNVDFVILSEKKIEKKIEKTVEFNDEGIFKESWIFNRHTKRNFGFAYGYKQDYDVMITLDDDCFPLSENYFQEHIERVSSTTSDFFNMLKLFSDVPSDVFEQGARGHPKKIENEYPVVVNQGLWHGDLDLWASTISNTLKSNDGKIPDSLSKNCKVMQDFVIPKGQLTTVCGMNVAFLKEVTPAFAWSYQEPDGDLVARYDDIWSGLFVKVILDKLDKRMNAGHPVILHDKGRRDITIDLKWEKNGDPINNYLWNNLPKLQLEGKDYATCYLEIAKWLEKPAEDADKKFLKKVSKAMYEWVDYLGC